MTSEVELELDLWIKSPLQLLIFFNQLLFFEMFRASFSSLAIFRFYGQFTLRKQWESERAVTRVENKRTLLWVTIICFSPHQFRDAKPSKHKQTQNLLCCQQNYCLVIMWPRCEPCVLLFSHSIMHVKAIHPLNPLLTEQQQRRRRAESQNRRKSGTDRGTALLKMVHQQRYILIIMNYEYVDRFRGFT